MRRIGKRDLTKGWLAWYELYEEHIRVKRALLAAGNKLLRPKFVACYRHWRRLAELAALEAASMTQEQQLQAEVNERRKLQAEMQAQVQALRDELDAARQAALDGRGLEAELQRQMAEQLAAEKEKRIEHTREMAIRRIAKRDLARGWVGWHDAYVEQARIKRMLLSAGKKLTKPKLVASWQRWHHDWDAERSRLMRTQAMSVEAQLRQQLAEAKEELAAARHVVVRTEGSGDQLQREFEARMEAEREKRIEHTRDMAIRRIAKRELSRGWVAWLDVYAEDLRRMRALKGAANRLLRPRFVSAYKRWYDSWQEEEASKRESRLGSRLAREVRRAQQAQAENDELRAELEKLRHAVADGRGAEAEAQRKLEEQIASERERRIEHIHNMAARRVKNRDLSMGWGKWHGDWEERRRLERKMQVSAQKLLRPKLVACYQHWRLDWQLEEQQMRSMTLTEQLMAQKKLVQTAQSELRAVRDELEATRVAIAEGKGVEIEQKRLMQEQVAKEREKRIEHTQQMVLRRVLKRDLALGWQSWVEPYLERKRQMRLLQNAGARMAKPKLAKGFQVWHRLAVNRRSALATMSVQAKLAMQTKEKDELQAKLQKVQTEFDDQRKLDEVALAEARSAMAQLQNHIASLTNEMSDEKKSAILAKAAEDAAKAEISGAKAKVRDAQELLKQQQAQAAEHLKKQLEETRGGLQGQLDAALKQIKQLKEELAVLEAEKLRANHTNRESGLVGPTRADAPAPAAAEEKKPRRRKQGVLGDVVFDEGRPLAEQLREALTKHAIRVLDLFRDWDEDGNGEVSKKEFRNAMPKLGLDLPKKVIDEVFESYDLDGSGVMEFEELKKMLKPPPSAATKKLWGKATDAAIADSNAQKGAGSAFKASALKALAAKK